MFSLQMNKSFYQKKCGFLPSVLSANRPIIPFLWIIFTELLILHIYRRSREFAVPFNLWECNFPLCVFGYCGHLLFGLEPKKKRISMRNHRKLTLLGWKKCNQWLFYMSNICLINRFFFSLSKMLGSSLTQVPRAQDGILKLYVFVGQKSMTQMPYI